MEARTKAHQRIYNVIDVRMLAQKCNKIMYKNMFSNFFLFPIGHLTHHPLPKSFFFIFFYLHGPLAFCMVHGFLPSKMTDTILVPIIKDKTGNASSKLQTHRAHVGTV